MRRTLALIGACICCFGLQLVAQESQRPWQAQDAPRPKWIINPLRPPSTPETTPAEPAPRSTPVPSVNRLTRLRDQLFKGDTAEAIRSVHELRQFGSEGATNLLSALTDKRLPSSIRYATLQALDDMGSDVVPSLAEHIHRDRGEWIHLTTLVRQLGGRAAAIAPALAKAMADESVDRDRRFSAAAMLIEIGPSARECAAPLVDLFEHCSDEEIREETLRVLASFGEVPNLRCDCLVERLVNDEEEPRVRAEIACVLAKQKRVSPVLVPTLVGLLHPSNDSDVCCRAAKATADLGDGAEETAEALIELLGHESSDVRTEAVLALGRFSKLKESALEALIGRLPIEESRAVKTALATTIARHGKTAIDRLAEGLRSNQKETIEATLGCLATIGPEAQASEDQLLQMLKSRDADWHLAVVHTLRAIKVHDGKVSGALSEVASNAQHSTETRIAAVETLGTFASVPLRTSAVLRELLEDLRLDAELRAAAARSLRCDLARSIPVLQKMLRDEEAHVRVAAAGVLIRRDDTREEALPILTAELASDEHSKAIARSLVDLGRPAIACLGKVLKDEEASTEARSAAARILGQLGREAVPELIEVTAEAGDLGSAAESALFEIGADHAVPSILEAMDREVTAAAGGPLSQNQRRKVDRLQQLLVDINGEMGGPGGSDIMEAMSSPPESPGAAPSESQPPAAAADPPFKTMPSTESQVSDNHDIRPRSGSAAQGADTRKATPPDELRTVKVFYGTNRKRLDTIFERREVEWRAFLPVIVLGTATMLLSALGFALSRSLVKAAFTAFGLIITFALAIPAVQQTARLESDSTRRPGPVYGGEPSGLLELGNCTVTIPSTHQPGEVETPSIFRLEFTEDPRKHIVVREVKELDRDLFFRELRGDLSQRGQQVLVFVHGYNVAFDDAARRTAQMAVDLKFPGVPMFFSWPSQANWHEYREDEKQVELAINPLKSFLTDVARQSGAKAVHLVAHSMGNRALTAALKEIEQLTTEQALFNQVVLAAPDIDAQIFRDRIAPAIAPKAQRVTLYASSNDLALLASRTFNSGDYRAGDTSGEIVVVPGVETIDVSQVDSSLLGHSYYGSNATVLTDLQELLLFSRAADDRPSLEGVPMADKKYWIFRPTAIAAASTAELPAGRANAESSSTH